MFLPKEKESEKKEKRERKKEGRRRWRKNGEENGVEKLKKSGMGVRKLKNGGTKRG